MSTALQTVQKFFPAVRRVEDALRPAKIEVTQQDAASKGIANHEACAMAVACKRKFHLDGVIISRSTAFLVKGKKARRFKLPESVSREVVSFDRGGGFRPGIYTLSAVPPASRLGYRSGGPSGRETGTGDKKFRHLTVGVRSVLGGANPEGEA